MEKEEKEICPACAEKGINELRTVKVEKEDGKIIKYYSPCGHKAVLVIVEDTIVLNDLVKVHPRTARRIFRQRSSVMRSLTLSHDVGKKDKGESACQKTGTGKSEKQ
ncbi:MAG TPA: hypothetical protein VI864_06760 [Candidatus Bathyarchaeia archaeon]|nr:hypothetical protein [Candidatus Bathyarchaeia archaeon]